MSLSQEIPVRHWISLILFLPLLAQAQPFSPTTPVFSATINIEIQHGKNYLGEDVVFAYWETYGVYGQTVKNCSITYVKTFLDNIQSKKNLLEALSTTPGSKWGWTVIAPFNINPWCLQ